MAYLYLDPGSSGTKILTSADFCNSYFVESGVEEIPTLTQEQRDHEKAMRYSFGAGIVEVDGKTYRVGNRPVTCLSQGLKYVGAIVKAIAAIAAMDCGRGDIYHLGFVLPLDEYSSCQSFADGLRECLPKAQVNGQPVQAKIAKTAGIRINPEGAGLIPPISGVHVAIMVGHTDISLVRFENGQVQPELSQTMSRVGIGAIASSLEIPGDDIEIALAISKGKVETLARNGLTRASARKAEQEKKARFVRSQIAPRLNAYPWSGVQSIVLGGGGARYLKADLEELLPIKPTIAKPPKGLKLFGSVDAARYGDLYGLAHLQLKDLINAKLDGDKAELVECEVV